MTTLSPPPSGRQRAPSKRALATRCRVLEAAEKVFAAKGFDGATIRDIAAEAGEPVGTIHHHGGGKEQLFRQTVARRAAPLSERRRAALEAARQQGPLTVESVLAAFFRPFFDLAREDPSWRFYARLVAYASSDARWRSLAAECFDPTFEHFIQTLAELMPRTSRQDLAATFVFSVSALLALLTSRDRISAIGGCCGLPEDELQTLIRFCACGMSSPQAK